MRTGRYLWIGISLFLLGGLLLPGHAAADTRCYPGICAANGSVLKWVQQNCTTPTARPTVPAKPTIKAANCNFTPLSPKNRVNYEFISRREQPGGKVATIGYVPTNRYGAVIGNSGVTIGIGVDLGKVTAAQLKRYGVSNRLINKLRPYLGLRGQAAYAYLQRHPLILHKKQAEALTRAVQTYVINSVANYYTKDSVPPVNFYSLPEGVQTVIADLAYQYGPALYKATPNFWRQVTHGRWLSALITLEKFGDNYVSRRMKEAYLLDQDILNNKVPALLLAIC